MSVKFSLSYAIVSTLMLSFFILFLSILNEQSQQITQDLFIFAFLWTPFSWIGVKLVDHVFTAVVHYWTVERFPGNAEYDYPAYSELVPAYDDFICFCPATELESGQLIPIWSPAVVEQVRKYGNRHNLSFAEAINELLNCGLISSIEEAI